MQKIVWWVAMLMVGMSVLSAAADRTTLLPEKTIQHIINEVSGETALEHIRHISEINRPSASKGFHRAAEYVRKKALEYGLQNVRIIELPTEESQWDARFGELWLVEPEEKKLIDFKEIATAVAVFSRSTDAKAELLDVGAGTEAPDYIDKEVRGKIVLASGHPQNVMPLAVFERGALGVVSSTFRQSGPQFDYPDQVGWGRIPVRTPEGKEGTFAFMISLRTAETLKERLRQGERLIVHAKIEAELVTPGKYEIVEAVIPGREIKNQQILFTAHLDHQKPGANDNASGSGNILEVARAIQTLIQRGKITRPRRDIKFWWAPEIAGEYAYFAKHPEAPKDLLININQDMVGAHQSKLNAQQFISRTPYSLPSYLSDVVQEFTEYVIATNQEVATHLFEPYSRPIIAPTGTRDSYRAVVSKYFDSTDHLVFNDAFIGVPGVDFTHWPDYYIHSQFDDLAKIDPTQLKRNAFIAIATALTVADADARAALPIAAAVKSRAMARMADDLRLGLGLPSAASSIELQQNYEDSLNLIQQAHDRELKALDSLKPLVQASQPVLDFLAECRRKLGELAGQMRDDVRRYYQTYARLHEISLNEGKLSEAEMQAAKIIPQRAASIAQYVERARSVPSGNRTGAILEFEIRNFIDGRRSILDIYRAVRAEAISGGYGEVTLDTVQQYINSLADAGIIKK